jgi:hypothetical protein
MTVYVLLLEALESTRGGDRRQDAVSLALEQRPRRVEGLLLIVDDQQGVPARSPR